MFNAMPLRHPCNDKLRLHYDEHYLSFEVQQYAKNGPLIENYLEPMVKEITTTIQSQLRTLIFRADLHFPERMAPSTLHQSNEVLTHFFRHFKYELKKASLPYRPFLRYIWAREQDTSDKPHYHLIIMLNNNVFNYLGLFEPDDFGCYQRDNLYHRMMRCWYKAMGYHPLDALGQLIHIAKHPVTKEVWVSTLTPHDWMALNDAIYNASYLCKAYTKRFGEGIRVFGTSQGG